MTPEQLAELDAMILAEAALPKKSEVDGQMAEGRSLDELARFRDRVAASVNRKTAGIHITRLSPPGAA